MATLCRDLLREEAKRCLEIRLLSFSTDLVQRLGRLSRPNTTNQKCTLRGVFCLQYNKTSCLNIQIFAIARLDASLLPSFAYIVLCQINHNKKTPNNAQIARCSSRYRLLFALSTTIVLDSLFDCLFRKDGTVNLLRWQTFQHFDHLFVGELKSLVNRHSLDHFRCR